MANNMEYSSAGDEKKCDLKGDGTQNTDMPLDSPNCTTTSSHRPLTRSQTGCVLKRPRRNDSPSEDTKKRGRTPRKNRKTSTSPAELSGEAEDNEQEASESSVQEDTASVFMGIDSRLDAMNMTTPESYTHSNSESGVERRGTKIRATLPVPVPNLTKKSRGRRVPTRLPNEAPPADPADTRMYVCKVETCGKCFHRGEHLKRHIRSIHTHEKPFECTYPLCNKNFNRHDNLLQHLKVHKDTTTPDSSCVDEASSPVQLRQTTPPQPVTTPPQVQPYYYSPYGTYGAYSQQERISATYQAPISSVREYASHSESVRPATNIAVSSLRTQISQSSRSPRI